MLTTDFWYWPTLVLMLLVGCWYLISKIRASLLSGFRFYRIAGLLEGIPYFIGAILFVVFPGFGIGWLLFAAYIPSIMGQGWEGSQEKKAAQTDPVQWEAWQSKRSQQSVWSRLFL